MPLLFDQQFPAWFAGVAFAAIGIGALVPAAIMSIAAANLFTRNIYKEYLRKDATHAQEAKVAKIASLVVKVGAVAFIIFLDPQFSIDLQLIGGVIILQTAPAVALGLYTRWLHRGALIAGWAAGMGLGMWMLYQIPNAATGAQALRRLGVPAVRVRLRHHEDDLRRLRRGRWSTCWSRSIATLILRAAKTAGGHRRHHAGRLLRRRGRPAARTAAGHPGRQRVLHLSSRSAPRRVPLRVRRLARGGSRSGFVDGHAAGFGPGFLRACLRRASVPVS